MSDLKVEHDSVTARRDRSNRTAILVMTFLLAVPAVIIPVGVILWRVAVSPW